MEIINNGDQQYCGHVQGQLDHITALLFVYLSIGFLYTFFGKSPNSSSQFSHFTFRFSREKETIFVLISRILVKLEIIPLCSYADFETLCRFPSFRLLSEVSTAILSIVPFPQAPSLIPPSIIVISFFRCKILSHSIKLNTSFLTFS